MVWKSGRILVDIKDEFSWTKWVNSCGHLMNSRGHFRGQKISTRIHEKCPKKFIFWNCPLKFANFEKKRPQEFFIHANKMKKYVSTTTPKKQVSTSTIFVQPFKVISLPCVGQLLFKIHWIHFFLFNAPSERILNFSVSRPT